ncbi:hypothetical protein BSKO_06010 [Bryopsis sp. KO-2023]|nr:hypothetical protein BSKO_06010 [Bryopsis sp. KO-2023]
MSKEKRKEQSPKAPAGVVPYITSPKALDHIEWMKKVLGAEVQSLMWADAEGKPVEGDHGVDTAPKKGWKVMHAGLTVNGGCLYISDEILAAKESQALRDQVEKEACRGFMCHLELEDVDGVWKKALDSKAKVKMELELQFWGARYGIFVDPFGYEWSVAKHVDPAPAKKQKNTKEDDVSTSKVAT